MDNLYLKIHSDSNPCLVPIETAITLFIIKYTETKVAVNFIVESPKDENSFEVDATSFSPTVLSPASLPENAKLCELPNIVEHNGDTTIAGFCATLRQIIQLKLDEEPGHHCQVLLGFKFSCLLSCSEVSTWTKFCEIDFPSTCKYQTAAVQVLPENLARFESHLQTPVRLHNYYKYTSSKKFADVSTVSRDELGNPNHSYAEGSNLTLSDIIIFVCIRKLIKDILPERILQSFPYTLKWYRRILEEKNVADVAESLFFEKENKNCEIDRDFIVPLFRPRSLYKDNRRFKTRNKIYKKQDETEQLLKMIKENDLKEEVNSIPFASDEIIDRNKIPYEATPEGGALPSWRLNRKFEQLENLCKPVIKLAKPSDTIVDFCSGSGHLGIIIAYLLPKCKVILLENKWESLKIARERVRKLKLNNVYFCKCNLDYFKGNFDIGTSLHACGVATDLVLRHCLQKDAIFVCCPCCYGSIKNCHHLSYPRSDIYRNYFDIGSYLLLSHAADQTHDDKNVKTKQGYDCMAVIDSDRKFHAMQFGYKVHLGKLRPPTCTPKNNILVGIPLSRLSEDSLEGF